MTYKLCTSIKFKRLKLVLNHDSWHQVSFTWRALKKYIKIIERQSNGVSSLGTFYSFDVRIHRSRVVINKSMPK